MIGQFLILLILVQINADKAKSIEQKAKSSRHNSRFLLPGSKLLLYARRISVYLRYEVSEDQRTILPILQIEVLEVYDNDADIVCRILHAKAQRDFSCNSIGRVL